MNIDSRNNWTVAASSSIETSSYSSSIDDTDYWLKEIIQLNLTSTLAGNPDGKYVFRQTNSSSESDHEAVTKDIQYGLIVFYSLATLISLVGNVTVIIVMSLGKRTSIRGYLINLAVSDITMAVFCIPFSYTNFMYNMWIFLPEFCRIVMFLQHVSVTSSVYTLVAIGIDRYKALVYPLNERWTKNRAGYVIVAIWIFSFATSFVQLIVSYSKEYNTLGGRKYYICEENWPRTAHDTYEKGYTIVVFIVTFGLPVLSLGYTYLSIVTMMCRYKLPGNAEPNRDEHRLQAKIKVINMMIAVMVCFVLCWFPLHILQFIIYFSPSTINCWTQQECFGYYMSFFVCHWIAMANSFMNPIIYCFMSKNFRDDLFHIVNNRFRKPRFQRSPSGIRSRSDAGSSFRSVLYVTQKTSGKVTRTVSVGSRLLPPQSKDCHEMKLFSDQDRLHFNDGFKNGTRLNPEANLVSTSFLSPPEADFRDNTETS